jgi:hypothetical protein
MNRALPWLGVIVTLAVFNLGGSCASHDKEVPNRIPQLADMVVEGHGKLKWTADMDGSIYVYDNDKKTIRYEGDVRRGEEVVVQPESDRIYVGGHVVYQENLEKHDWHRVYFVGGQASDQAPR